MGDIAVTDSLNTQLLHGFADVDFGSLCDGECGVVIMQNLQHPRAVEGFHRLVGFWLAEAGGDHLCQVFLLLVVLVELLDARHLLVVEPECTRGQSPCAHLPFNNNKQKAG